MSQFAWRCVLVSLQILWIMCSAQSEEPPRDPSNGATASRDDNRGVMPDGKEEQKRVQRVFLAPRHIFDDPAAVALCEAIGAQNLAEIDRLVQAGAEINKKGKFGITPLHWALAVLDSGIPGKDDKPAKVAVVRRLLDLGADPNASTHREPEEVRAELSKQVFDYVYPYGPIGLNGEAPIHRVARLTAEGIPSATLMEWMIARGGDVDLRLQAGWGEAPLHWAIQSGNRAVMEKLVERGADINRLDASGRTPLDRLSSRQHATALFLLQHGAEFYDAALDQYSRYVVAVAKDDDFYRQSPDAPEAGAYRSVVEILAKAGVDLQAAREDRLPIRETLDYIWALRRMEVQTRFFEDVSQ